MTERKKVSCRRIALNKNIKKAIIKKKLSTTKETQLRQSWRIASSMLCNSLSFFFSFQDQLTFDLTRADKKNIMFLCILFFFFKAVLSYSFFIAVTRA